MDRIHIIIDTREQRPWSFDQRFATVSVGTLRTGDYALAGDDGFAIERKSLDDFLGTISTGWERFGREVERMADWPAKVVIVEADFDRCCFSDYNGELVFPEHNHPQLTPQFITKRIAELTMAGVSVLFMGDAGKAACMACKILMERHRERETDTV